MRQVIPHGSVVGFVARFGAFGGFGRFGGFGAFGVLGALGALVVLAGVEQTVGLGVAGWAAGVGSAVALAAWVAVGPAGRAQPGPGPADPLTLTRAMLACGVAALAADAFTRTTQVALLVGLASVAVIWALVEAPRIIEPLFCFNYEPTRP